MPWNHSRTYSPTEACCCTGIRRRLYETVYQVCLSTPVEGVIWVCYKHPPDTVRALQSRYGSKVYKLTNNTLFIDMISGGTDSNDDVIHCSDSANYDCMLHSIYNAIGEFSRCVVVFDDMKEAMSHEGSVDSCVERCEQ